MKHVLIAVDLQNDFVSMALGTPEAQAIIPAAAEMIRDSRYDTVIATMDTHGENYMETAEGKHLPVVHCVRGTEGWQFDPVIAEALKERNARIIEKPTFGSTELADLLEKEQPESVTLIGLCTDICVISNALLVKSRLYETPVMCAEKACAGVTPALHNQALAVMKSCQIDII